MLLDDQAPLIGSNLFESNVRPERKKRKKKLLYYAILNSISLMQASANGN